MRNRFRRFRAVNLLLDAAGTFDSRRVSRNRLTATKRQFRGWSESSPRIPVERSGHTRSRTEIRRCCRSHRKEYYRVDQDLSWEIFTVRQGDCGGATAIERTFATLWTGPTGVAAAMPAPLECSF